MNLKVTVYTFLLLSAAALSLHSAVAFFSDSATSTTNTFSAAAVFPTATPSATIVPTASPTPTPTPGINAGDVVINEIMWMGSQGDAADEWIELRNMTSGTIDLSNWVVEDLGSGGNDVTIPSGKSISPNGFFLIANDSRATSVIDVDPDLQVNVSLNNNGEPLTLKTSTATIIDVANDAGDWFAGDDNPEKSMERNDVPGDGTISTNWHTATSQTNIDVGNDEVGTPRAANSTP